MSKNEFLNQLSGLLSDISPEERDEALAYYREYIEDAGFENENAILEELGTPKEIAAEIKSGILNKNNPDIHYSSNTVKNSPEPYYSTQNNQNKYNHTYYTNNQNPQVTTPKRESNPTLIILAVLAAIFLSPVWIGLLSTLFGVAVSILATIAGLIIGFGVAGLVCIIVGILVFIIGFPVLLQNPIAGFACFGAGLVVAAFGILFFLFSGWLCIGVIPGIIHAISTLIHRFTNRNKETHV